MNFSSFVSTLLAIINPAVAVLSALALAAFMWGIVRYIFAAGGSETKVAGRDTMLWGIIALVVLVCVWGIVNLIKNSFLGGAGSTAGTYQPSTTYTPSGSSYQPSGSTYYPGQQ